MLPRVLAVLYVLVRWCDRARALRRASTPLRSLVSHVRHGTAGGSEDEWMKAAAARLREFFDAAVRVRGAPAPLLEAASHAARRVARGEPLDVWIEEWKDGWRRGRRHP